VELAFRNVHRVSLGGVLRSVQVRPSDGNTDDARPEDLRDDRSLVCELCGAAGQWDWVGSVNGSEVELLGGFGPIKPNLNELLLLSG
jgi:hypothetical protein